MTKDGSAGLLTYKDTNEVFTINHHACVLKLKEEWKEKLHLRWFAHQYQNRFFEVVTSKSDNGVFSTEWFERLKFEVPLYDEQMRIWGKLERVIKLKEQARILEKETNEILSQSLKF